MKSLSSISLKKSIATDQSRRATHPHGVGLAGITIYNEYIKYIKTFAFKAEMKRPTTFNRNFDPAIRFNFIVSINIIILILNMSYYI